MPRDVEEFRLSGGRYARNALAAVVKAGGLELRVCTVHLSWPSGGGDSEAAALLRGLGASAPAGVVADVIAGDFNADATDETIRHMLAARYRDAGAVAGDTGLTVLMQRWQGATVVPDRSGELFARIDYQFWKETGSRRGNIRACRRVFNRNVVGGVYLPRVSDHVGLLGVYDLPAS